MSTLYIVATPIGNLDDITKRAVKTLADVSFIAAEDTRVTKKLLNHLEIQTPLISWHHHSTETSWKKIKKELDAGHDIAYVTDAGTPGVSDPGGKLIELCLQECPDVIVVPIPGPSALAAAISVAGIPMDNFRFMGFLPHKKGRQKKISEIAASTEPVILFESVHRIKKLLRELAETEKKVIVCRELTKKFETIYRGTPKVVVDSWKESEIKGEYVVIIYE